MENPALNPAVVISATEDSYLAYDPVRDRLHTLNALAALVIELCDGSRSLTHIHELVGPLLPDGQTGAIDHWVQQAVEAGLLVDSADSGHAHRPLSAQELFDLAHRLEERRHSKPALVCARRVTELAPDSSKAWYFRAELAHNVGKRDEERESYERYIELKPDDEEIKHILIALRDAPAPTRMSNECVLHIYNGFASSFDERLRDDLGYRGPEHVLELIAPLLKARVGHGSVSEANGGGSAQQLPEELQHSLEILDLGCGSGLAGVVFKPLASRMIGVDLSPEMIKRAEARDLYDKLDSSEITEWLEKNPDSFDLILACDCFIYFGDLRQVVIPVAKHLKPGGIFSFTLERDEHYPFRLTDTGRYAHHPDHVREAAAESGLSVARLEEGFLRREYDVDVVGLFVALKKEG